MNVHGFFCKVCPQAKRISPWLFAGMLIGSGLSLAAETVPVPGMVTMVDLGAKTCIPCKMMEPIIKELKQEYQGKAAVLFIDVREQPEEGKRFSIRAIPTQIFYDAQGNEVSRHQGFLDKKSIVATFEKLGVE